MESVEILRVAVATCNIPVNSVLADYCYPGWTFAGASSELHRLFATVLQLGHTIDRDNPEIRFISFQPVQPDGEPTGGPDSEFQLIVRLKAYGDAAAGNDFTTGVFFSAPGPELAGSDPRIDAVLARLERVQEAFERELLAVVRDCLPVRGQRPSGPDDDLELPGDVKEQCIAFAQRIPEFITVGGL
jgi:hypothetical protein